MLNKMSKTYVICSPMEGVLMKSGKPLANTKIIRMLKWNGSDAWVNSTFISDDQGRFFLPIHEETLSLGIFDTFVAKMDLRVETDEGVHEIWCSSKLRSKIYEETGGPVSELVCDIDADEVAAQTRPMPTLTKCRWKDMPY